MEEVATACEGATATSSIATSRAASSLQSSGRGSIYLCGLMRKQKRRLGVDAQTALNSVLGVRERRERDGLLGWKQTATKLPMIAPW